MGESNSRLSDANRLHYHYANGPYFTDYEWVRIYQLLIEGFYS